MTFPFNASVTRLAFLISGRPASGHLARHASLARGACALVAAAATLVGASGCVPLVVAGAAIGGATVVATDRRSAEAQLEDEVIEQRAGSRMRSVADDDTHVNITSWNGQVLITGEASSPTMRQRVEQAVIGVGNVKSVVNDLALLPASGIAQRSGDAFITAKVKASLVDARDIFANAYKVVTERGIVYLMGRVTRREADRATQIARGIGGVQKVVRIMEVVSDAEIAALNRGRDSASKVEGTPAAVTGSRTGEIAPSSSRVPLPPMEPLPPAQPLPPVQTLQPLTPAPAVRPLQSPQAAPAPVVVTPVR